MYFCTIVHKIATIILLFAFLGQTFTQGVYYLDYLIDKAEYLARCENKSRPKLQCNGKCLLMKRIQEQEKKEQEQAPQMKLANKAEVISSKSFFPDFKEVFINSSKPAYFVTDSGSPIDRPSFFFHPPDVA